MKIKTYLNTTKENVEAKKYNIWIGVSLGNKFFTKDNIQKYIEWALEFTKEDVLVVIGDGLQAINYEVLDGYNRIRALRKAIESGDKKEKEIQEILSTLKKQNQKKVNVVRYKHVTGSKYHDLRLEILKREFYKNTMFHDYVISILKENKKVAMKQLSDESLNRLADYVLHEIPVYLNGAKYNGLPEHGGKTYLLQIYPGIGLLDTLLMEIQEGKRFPSLTKELKITDTIAILEGYPD